MSTMAGSMASAICQIASCNRIVSHSSFPGIGKNMMAVISLSLCFGGSSRDMLRGNNFGGRVHCCFLLSGSGFFSSFLCPNNVKGILALGFGFSKLFGFGGSLGLICFCFSELFLRVSSLVGFLQVFLLLLQQSSYLSSFLFLFGLFMSLSLGLSITKSLLSGLDFKMMEFCVLRFLGANLGIGLTRLRNSCPRLDSLRHLCRRDISLGLSFSKIIWIMTGFGPILWWNNTTGWL